MHSTKCSVYKVGIQFDQDPFAVEQNNYLTKIVNVYIVYDFYIRPRNPTINLKFMNCLDGAISVVTNSDCMYLSCYIRFCGPIAVTCTPDYEPELSKEFPDIHATIKCGFTQKSVREMIQTYSQMHGTNKYSQHSSIIWPAWLNA